MGKKRAVLAAFFCAASIGAVQEVTPAASPPDTPKLCFEVGEDLVYRVYWGVIPIGKARIVTRWVEESGRRLLAIRYRARSSGVLARIYPVDDVVESVIDPATFLPLRFEKNLSEGRHRHHEITTFDHEKREATWHSLLKGKTKTYAIDADTRDIVSFVYYMRSQKFKPAETNLYRVMADEKVYDLLVKAEDLETRKIKRFGKVRSMRITPEAQFNGLFVRKGKMTIWVSDDDRYIMTRVDARVPVASIHTTVWEVRGPGSDSWIKETLRLAGEGEGDLDPEVERALGELD